MVTCYVLPVLLMSVSQCFTKNNHFFLNYNHQTFKLVKKNVNKVKVSKETNECIGSKSPKEYIDAQPPHMNTACLCLKVASAD